MTSPERCWRFVLFDFDGVLFDSREAALALYEDLRGAPPFDRLPSVRSDGHFGSVYRGALRTSLLAHGLSEVESQDFFDEHASRMREIGSDLKLFPGVADYFRTLDPARYAIITSSYSTLVQAAFEAEGVTIPSDNISGHEIRATKTNKIKTVLDAHGLAASDAVYVGDMESDIIYCRNVPIRCIAASYGYHPAHILVTAEPLAIADNPDRLRQILEEGMTE